MITEILNLLDLHPDVRVFPVVGKEPAHREVASWKIAATRDVEQVAAWWTGTDYGVGVTGLVVIDCDADTGATAQAVFGPDVRSGLTWHGNPGRVSYAFAQPAQPYGCKVWAAPDGGRGGEVKGLGGYVVMPPSRHDGDGCPDCAAGTHGYTWERRLDRAPEVPATVAAALDAIVTPPRHLVEGITTEGPLPCEADQREPCEFIAQVMATYAAAVDLPKSGRHDLMVNQQITLLRYGEREHRGIGTALDETWRVHLHALDRPGTRPERKAQAAYEWSRAMDGARHKVAASAESLASDRCHCPEPVDEQTLDAIFDATEVLSGLRQYARHKGVAPLGLLGCVLAIVVSESPADITMPDDGSPNLYVALVGEAGTGKSRCWRQASNYVQMFDSDRLAREVSAPTGEGLIASFLATNEDDATKKAKPLIQTPESANVRCYVDEIEQLTSAGGRVGSTTESIMRAMWSGMGVGTQNADAQRRRHLVAGTYRLGVVAGVQPSLAHRLLSQGAAESGTAQRWLWMPATDHNAASKRGPQVEPPMHLHPKGDHKVAYPPEVQALMEAEGLDRLRGEVGDKLEQHATYLRLKVATALALLHATTDVSPQLWEVAGHVMGVHRATRAGVIALMGRQATEAVRAEGARDAEKEEGFTLARAQKGARVWAQVVARHMAQGEHDREGCTRACLTRGVTRFRDIKEEVMSTALALGLVDNPPGKRDKFIPPGH